MVYEVHHVIPISLWWPDKPQNLMELEKSTHRHVLHATLDIPMIKYKTHTRKIKLRLNDTLIIPPDAVDMMGDIQKEFFLNIGKLPKRLQQKHVWSMMQLCDLEKAKCVKLWMDYADKPNQWREYVDTVHNLHDHYLNIKKAISEELIATLRKHYCL